jgi:hypothetical protein
MPLISTGTEGQLYLNATIILNSKRMLYASPLGLKQCVEATDSRNLLHLVVANFTDLKSVTADSGFAKPDTYHLPLSTDVYLSHVNNHLNCEFSYRNFAAGNYALLYNILSTCGW